VLARLSPLTSWSAEPVQLAAIALGVAVFLLRRRGRTLLVWLAIMLAVVAAASPLAAYGEQRSFAVHMAQHLLFGDLVPLALVLGVGDAGRRVPRLLLVAALPLWAVDLYAWHVPGVYEAALHHPQLHALQHVALFAIGTLFWAAVLGPRLGIGTRLLDVLVMMLAGLTLASIFLWWPRVLYSTYRHAGEFAGLSPLTDQRVGGGLMLIEGTVLALSVAGWLILQLLREEPELSGVAEGASPSP
jgi:putative membrane protein